MASVHRYQVIWAGFTGAPGYTAFMFRYATEPGSAPTICSALDAWCNAIKTTLPSSVTTTPNPTYDVLDEVTGALLDQKTDAGSFTSHAGTITGGYAADSGAVVNHRTGVVVSGKTLRGRSFMVPLGGGAFDTDGTLSSGVSGILTGAYDTLRAATTLAPLSVWHRPIAHAGGVAAPITSHYVKDHGSVLRSRRK